MRFVMQGKRQPAAGEEPQSHKAPQPQSRLVTSCCHCWVSGSSCAAPSNRLPDELGTRRRSPVRRRDSCQRQASLETPWRSRQPRRDAESEPARQQRPGAARGSSKWDSSGPAPVTELPSLPSTNGVAPMGTLPKPGQASASAAGDSSKEQQQLGQAEAHSRAASHWRMNPQFTRWVVGSRQLRR